MPVKAPFKIFKRKSAKFYYARYLKPDGTYTAGRSTGETTPRKAEAAAWEYLKGGKVATSAFLTVSDLAMRQKDDSGQYRAHFFDWDGEHTLNKRSAGKRISQKQCQHDNTILEKHVVRILGNVRLEDVDTQAARRLRNQLFKEEYAGSTINKVLGVFRQIVDAADDAHLLRHNIRIERAAVKNKARGVLSPEEVRKLFADPWDNTDPRAFAASMLSAAAGLRLGEVQGLRISDVEAGRVTVRGVWSDSTGGYRPGTKNGQPSRSIPIPESVDAALQQCIDLNPWGGEPGDYLFFSLFKRDRPAGDTVLTRGYYKALVGIGIPEDLRKVRNVTFHSHRHFFNTLLLESRIPVEKIQSLTGHLSRSMTEHYYHPGEMEDVAAAQRALFMVVKAANA